MTVLADHSSYQMVASHVTNPTHLCIISGANLKMYHGTQIDHINFNSAIIYFACNQGGDRKVMVKDEVPTFEHVKAATNQAHFKVYTHLAC